MSLGRGGAALALLLTSACPTPDGGLSVTQCEAPPPRSPVESGSVELSLSGLRLIRDGALSPPTLLVEVRAAQRAFFGAVPAPDVVIGFTPRDTLLVALPALTATDTTGTASTVVRLREPGPPDVDLPERVIVDVTGVFDGEEVVHSPLSVCVDVTRSTPALPTGGP